jgi:hypothetical protein
MKLPTFPRPLLLFNALAFGALGVVLIFGPEVPAAESAIPGVLFLVVSLVIGWRWSVRQPVKRSRGCPEMRGILASNVWRDAR